MRIIIDVLNSRVENCAHRIESMTECSPDDLRRELRQLAAGSATDAVRTIELFLPNIPTYEVAHSVIGEVEKACRNLRCPDGTGSRLTVSRT